MTFYRKTKTTENACNAYDAVTYEADTRGHIHLMAGDELVFDNSLYKLGSVVSYAIDNNQCPIDAVERSQREHHNLHYVLQSAIVLSIASTKKKTVISINLNDVYRFEGRLFKFSPANNNNLALEQQVYPKGFY